MRRIIPGVALLLVGTQSLLASVYFAALRSAFDSTRPQQGQAVVAYREWQADAT
jgi:hypothetical protein